MTRPVLLKPNHKAIQEYYQVLKSYGDRGVKHEGALETAFKELLAHAAKLHHCTLTPKEPAGWARAELTRQRIALDSVIDQ